MDLFNLKKYDWRILLHPKKLFLENFGIKQTLVKNTFWLSFSEVVTTLLKVFLFIYIARILGATEYGKFSFALAFVSLFVIFSNLGIFRIIIREIAKDQKKEKDFSAVITLKIFLSLATFILIFIGSFFITGDLIIRKIILILGLHILTESFLVFFNAFFQGHQKMEYEALLNILQAVLVTGFGFFVLFVVPSAQSLGLAYFLGSSICLIFVLIFFRFKFFPLKISFKTSIWKEYIKMSYPLALVAALGTINANIDSTIMGSMTQITATGWYNAAQRIIQASLIPIGLIGTSFYPVLSKFYSWQIKENFHKAAGFFLKMMFFLSFPIAVGGIVLAPKIINLVYNPSYFPSVFAFQILIFASVFSALTGPFSYSLVVSDQQKKVFLISLFGTIANIFLNLILIPKFSLYGACFATLLTYVLTMTLTLKLALPYIGIKIFDLSPLGYIFKIASCTFLMYLVISQPKIYNLFIIWPFLIGLAVYLASFFLFNFLFKYAKLRKQYD